MVSREYLYLVLAVPILAVAGCSSLSEQAGITYAKSVTQLGINPIYPPREDLQVGDIYAVEAGNATADRYKLKSAFVAVNDVTGDIRAYLHSRYKFADTEIKDASGDVPASVKPRQLDKRPDAPLLAPSDLTTLPIDALPQIEVDSGISIGVQGQPQGLGAVFGFAAAKTLKMSLQYGRVTSYEIPMAVAEEELGNFCDHPSTAYICENDYLANWINQKYGLGPGSKGIVKRASALMVTKVYLARQIVYTFNDATLAAAVAQAVSDDGKVAPPAPTVTQADIDKAFDSKNPKLIEATNDLVKSLSDSATSNGGAQGSFQIAIANKQSVSISEIFDRPVVIAYVGVSSLGAPSPKQ